MIVDRYGGEHSTTNTAAVVAFEDAVYAVAAHRAAGEHLMAALADDPNLPAAHALKGLGCVLLGKAENFEAGRKALPVARAALEKSGGGTPCEITLVEALALASKGHLKQAAIRLEAHAEENPRAFLAIKLANALRFMTGQAELMMRTTNTALSSWSPQSPGYGFILGMHAFGLEECGAFDEAERVGRLAVRHEPADSWGVHAVSHVMEMRGRTHEGIQWMEASRPLWPRCNNFGYHLAWHLGLFHLETGNYDAVLDIYDREVRPTQTDDFRDMSNAVSMLWRLEQEGVNVGPRWEGLYEIAHQRRTDTTYVFASLHYLLALLACGDRASAMELLASMQNRAAVQTDDQAAVTQNVGLALAETITELPNATSAGTSSIEELAILLPTIGGSHAQRDVFMRTLMSLSAGSSNQAGLEAVKRVRESLRKEDRFSRLISERLRLRTSPHLADAMPQIDAH